MISHKGKLYIATIDEKNPTSIPNLYSSTDPEFYPWEPIIDTENPLYDKSKNIVVQIQNFILGNL